MTTKHNTKPIIEHCPNGCIVEPKWHYRVKLGDWFPYWGTWQECVDWVNRQNTLTREINTRRPVAPLGKACKLVYNSAYGKFAQSVGVPKKNLGSDS